MSTIQIQETVGQLVARQPVLSYTFAEAGVDYCCGGKKTLEQVCQEKGLDLQAFVAKLEEAVATNDGEPAVNASHMSLTDLADHIEQTHHTYLREQLPWLRKLTSKVASVHGGGDTRLWEVRETLREFSEELMSHMLREERILFPMIRRLEVGDRLLDFHNDSIVQPIQHMEMEHTDAGESLERMRTLTDGYTPPQWACNTYRAMLDGLARLERDMHQHVHKENSILFPRAIDLEAALCRR